LLKLARAQAAANKAAVVNAKKFAKGKWKSKVIKISVPDPKRPGKFKKVSVKVKVPAKKKAAVKTKVEIRKLKIPDPKNPGKFITKKVRVKRHFKSLRQLIPDPLNPGKVVVVDVKVEAKKPPPDLRKQLTKAADKLEKKIEKKSDKLKTLAGHIAHAKRMLRDSPVLEDGAPAPPDPQQVKMAQDLYTLLDATVMHNARQIGERYFKDARDQVILAAANHENVQDFNIRMNQEHILPKDN